MLKQGGAGGGRQGAQGDQDDDQPRRRGRGRRCGKAPREFSNTQLLSFNFTTLYKVSNEWT